MRKIICNIDDKRKIDVKFIGSYLTKRDLLQLLRAIRLEYRRQIRIHRQKMSSDASRRRVEVEKQEAETEKIGVKTDGKNQLTQSRI